MTAAGYIAPAVLAGRLLWAAYRWQMRRAAARAGDRDLLEPAAPPADVLPKRPAVAPEHLGRDPGA